MTATLTFLGAAGSVTGSKYLLTIGERRILVDSGMFQGEKDLRLRNWADFPVPPDTITDILLTHAHLDHCGYLPVLVRGGFSGPIWCTSQTAKLAEIVLRDAAFLQERDALDAAEGGWSKHNPPKPLYDSGDVAKTLPLLTAVEYDRDLDLGDGIFATYVRAGHILGSASIRVQTPETSVIFSGDIGRADHPVLRSRETPEGADYVLVESTYGDREHPEPRNLPHEHFADIIRRTIDRGGSVLVPAFAVDRTEVVLKTLADMRRHGRIPKTPIAVNSPMALAALAVYRANPDELRADLDLDDLMGDIREIHTAEESREFTGNRQTPGIVIASSGMATGGRVLHHLERMLPDERNSVVFTGYQAIGTRGRSLVEGATRLKMHGRYVGVRAEILQDHEFSVHADASDILDWVRALSPKPTTVFCVHGEPEATAALEARIEKELGVDAVAPKLDEVVALTPPATTPPSRPAAYLPAREGGPTIAGLRPAAGAQSGGVDVSVPADVAAGLGIESIESVSVSGDLRPRREDDNTVVLEGTITIRLTH
ncbi:MAG: MBL fold metallo-hydrolase [Dermatophilus congolensis]|nr:MBL fold metallo-hydrolase [Dermatophilus congolensis]